MTAKITNPDDVIFCDGILKILYRRFSDNKLLVEEIILCAEFDEPVTLGEIQENYQEVTMVIFEEPLKGDIYKFNNYRQREWTKVGSTIGYA